MNPNQDMPQYHDALRDRLHEGAMAERPAFSPHIHRQVMLGIQSPGTRASRGLIGAAAAAVFLLAGAISINWLVRPHRAGAPRPAVTHSGDSQAVTQLPTQTASVLLAKPIRLTLNLGGIVSARIWPPRISMGLPLVVANAPVAEDLPAQTTLAPLGSPEWLLARFAEPASGARAALIDLMPPEMHALAGQTGFQQ